MAVHKIILSDREAHVILRALTTHTTLGNHSDDTSCCNWLTRRLLRAVDPETPPQLLSSAPDTAGEVVPQDG